MKHTEGRKTHTFATGRLILSNYYVRFGIISGKLAVDDMFNMLIHNHRCNSMLSQIW